MDMKNFIDSAPSLSLKTHNGSVVAIVHDTSHNFGSSLSLFWIICALKEI